MARIASKAFTAFIYATDKKGRDVAIFERESAPDYETTTHRTVGTIIDLGVAETAPAETPRSRVLVTAFGLGRTSTTSHYVRETPEELSGILKEVYADEPEMWDGTRKKIGALVNRITGRGRQRAPA